MSNTAKNLELCEAILALIEQKRLESGDPTIGSAIENAVLTSQFQEIETDILENPGAIEPWLMKRRKRGEA